MIQSLSEYQQIALFTATRTGNDYGDLRHGACGLVTEVGEIVDAYKRHWFYKTPLNTKNLLEEIGDVLWYIAITYEALQYPILENPDKDLEEITPPKLDMILAKLVKYAGNVFSVSFAYPEEALESGLAYDLKNLLYNLSFLAAHLDCTLFACADMNVLKLRKRYPNGFTTEAAVNRDKENELSHIKESKDA